MDLGARGPGPGDQFIFSGDVFDHAGGTKLGHATGLCTTLSGNDTTGETMCTQPKTLAETCATSVANRSWANDDAARIVVTGTSIAFAEQRGRKPYRDRRGELC